MTSNLVRMMMVITVAWVLILVESYLFFFVIRPAAPNIHESVFSSVLKVSSSILLAGVWIVVMFGLEYYLFRRAGA